MKKNVDDGANNNIQQIINTAPISKNQNVAKNIKSEELKIKNGDNNKNNLFQNSKNSDLFQAINNERIYIIQKTNIINIINKNNIDKLKKNDYLEDKIKTIHFQNNFILIK